MSDRDPSEYMRKAHESLASAEADLEARRYNSAANRAYYGAFQAAVAALVKYGVRAKNGSWEHKSVMREFSRRLVLGREVLPPETRGVLERLLEVRVVGDYQTRGVGQGAASRAVEIARSFAGRVAAVVRSEGS